MVRLAQLIYKCAGLQCISWKVNGSQMIVCCQNELVFEQQRCARRSLGDTGALEGKNDALQEGTGRAKPTPKTYHFERSNGRPLRRQNGECSEKGGCHQLVHAQVRGYVLGEQVQLCRLQILPVL